MAPIESTPAFVSAAYERMARTLAVVRKRLGRPLNLSEKIFLSHLDDPGKAEIDPGKAYLLLRPDRVAMQDATAQMALLQFMLAGRKTAAVPTTVHCDHLIRAYQGASADMQTALLENNEVYKFLEQVSKKYGIGFWKPGAGIIHQVVLENYAFPGGLMIGTDSHTPNAGGLGMGAVGVGGADAVDVMAGFPWEVLQPQTVGVYLTGEMSGWTAPKDVILWVLGQLTVKGGTNRVVVYFGPGARSISCTGKGTITNMGAELEATGRAELAKLAARNPDLVENDPEVEADPEPYFDVLLRLDLSKLEPYLVGPHTPDLARPVSAMKGAVAENDYPDDISVSLIGSCTNSSYEDIARAVDVAEQAAAHGARMKTPLMVTPGSEQIFQTIKRDGFLEKLESVGATVLANACGPCIGQWKRDEVKKGTRNTIVTSFNRNFPGRNDENPDTMAFMGSPEIVMAYGLSGKLSFDPERDELESQSGERWRLSPPAVAPELPPGGFVTANEGYLPPAQNGAEVDVSVSPTSKRVQLLEPFDPPRLENFVEMPLLLKTKGKTTTDHISPAGPWLRYRGHLDKISDNMFTGAINAFDGARGKTRNPLDASTGDVPQVARALRAAGKRWVVVGDDNYGEGSSREHAAMSPRLLGAAAVIVRGFARIHETNLKKQGVLPLTFADGADYEKVRETDRVSLAGLEGLAPGSDVTATLHHDDGSTEKVALRHTLNAEQVDWWKAGSALNLLRHKG